MDEYFVLTCWKCFLLHSSRRESAVSADRNTRLHKFDDVDLKIANFCFYDHIESLTGDIKYIM